MKKFNFIFLIFRIDRISEKLTTANVNNVREGIDGAAKSQSQFREYQDFEVENNETNPYDITPALQIEYESDLEYQFKNQTNASLNFDKFKHDSADLSSNNQESIDNSEPAVYAIVQKTNIPLHECFYASVNKNKNK